MNPVTSRSIPRLRVIRDVEPRKHPVTGAPLTPGVRAGTVLYAWPGPADGLGPNEVAVTFMPGEPPWFGVAKDAIEEA